MKLKKLIFLILNNIGNTKKYGYNFFLSTWGTLSIIGTTIMRQGTLE